MISSKIATAALLAAALAATGCGTSQFDKVNPNLSGFTGDSTCSDWNGPYGSDMEALDSVDSLDNYIGNKDKKRNIVDSPTEYNSSTERAEQIYYAMDYICKQHPAATFDQTYRVAATAVDSGRKFH